MKPIKIKEPQLNLTKDFKNDADKFIKDINEKIKLAYMDGFIDGGINEFIKHLKL